MAAHVIADYLSMWRRLAEKSPPTLAGVEPEEPLTIAEEREARREGERRGRQRRGQVLVIALGLLFALRFVAGAWVGDWANRRADDHAAAVEARVRTALTGVTWEMASDHRLGATTPSIDERLEAENAHLLSATYGTQTISFAVDAARGWWFWEPRCVRADVGMDGSLVTTVVEADDGLRCLRDAPG